jgi:tRNA(Ile)-lysidine synthase
LSPPYEEVAAFAAQVTAFVPTGPVVIALSGGADSAALALAAVAREDPVRAITVDHGLPGSALLVAAAREIAAVLGLTHEVVEAHGGVSETDLRLARIEAIEAALRPGEVVLTGHTRDDQAETVLGNLLRGAGPAGLAGIPARRGVWIRPMLDISREAARRIAGLAGLPFVDDPQNDDPAIRRNQLRQVTIPSLETRYNPALKAALARTARLAAADDEMLEKRAAAVPIRREEEAVLVPAAALATLPTPVGSRVARRAIRMLLDPYPGSAEDVAAVMDAVSGTIGQLAGGLLAEREGPFVTIHSPEAPAVPKPVELPVPGSVRFGAWLIVSGAEGDAALGRQGAVIAATGPLVVRAVAPGDRIRVRGGTKKVFDALGEAGVPRRLRRRWPVVESGGRIAWLVSIRAADERDGDVGVAATRVPE